VLTGVHVGAYGRDGVARPPKDAAARIPLGALIERILRETSIAASVSLHPAAGLHRHLIELWAAEPRLCRHLHLPSERQRRRAAHDGPWLHDGRVRRHRGAGAVRRAGVFLGTDVIAGVPERARRTSRKACASSSGCALRPARLQVPTGPAPRRHACAARSARRSAAAERRLAGASLQTNRHFREQHLGQRSRCCGRAWPARRTRCGWRSSRRPERCPSGPASRTTTSDLRPKQRRPTGRSAAAEIAGLTKDGLHGRVVEEG